MTAGILRARTNIVPAALAWLALLGACALPLSAMHHELPYGEPYELAGKRLVFTSGCMPSSDSFRRTAIIGHGCPNRSPWK